MADPDKLARYRPIRSLGSGGMGTVTLAEDTVLGRQVALKRVSGMAGEQGMLRLRREALVGASVSHPNLVSIYDVETSDDGDVVIVMEYVEGETLRQAISRRQHLPASDALPILAGAAAGLDAIHQQGIVHRDVKPANILLGANGTVKVADLGIASVADRTRITTSGAVLGSLSYMAPEQLDDSPATPAVDVYALAAVAYEVLSGQKARQESNPVALAYAISTQPPPDLRKAWPQAPAEAAELLMRAMSRDPGDRPGSAGQLVGRLRTAFNSEITQRAKPAPAPSRPTPSRAERLRRDGADPAEAAAGAAAEAAAVAAEAPGAQAATKPEVEDPSRSPRRRPQRDAAGTAAPERAAVRELAPVPERAAPPDPAPPFRPARDGRRPSRSRLLVPLVGLVVVAAVVAVALSAGGPSSKSGSHRAASTGSHHHASAGATSQTQAATGSSSSTSSSSTTSAPPSASGTSSPASAVQAFYTLAARHHYTTAWALTDPTLQSQLRGYQSFENTFSPDVSITFRSARTVSQSGGAATVAISTKSVQTTGTHYCTGTVDLRSAGAARWQLHQLNVSCS